MNIVVCVKQIPDPANPVRAGSRQPLPRSTRRTGLDDGDRYGVEVAFSCAEASRARSRWFRWARPATCRAFARHSPWGPTRPWLTTTRCGARELSTTPRFWRPPSHGRASISSCAEPSRPTATAGSAPAGGGTLGVPALTFAARSSVDGHVRSNSRRQAGYNEVICTLPAVLRSHAGVVEPRYPTFKGIMAAKSKPVETSRSRPRRPTLSGRPARSLSVARRAGSRRQDRRRRRGPPRNRRQAPRTEGGLMKIWVFVEESNGAAEPVGLEAADQGPSARSAYCRLPRAESDAIGRAGRLRSRFGVYVLSGGGTICRQPARRRACRHRRGATPRLILFGLTYTDRDVAGRLSRPPRQAGGLERGDVARTATVVVINEIFGGTQLVETAVTGRAAGAGDRQAQGVRRRAAVAAAPAVTDVALPDVGHAGSASHHRPTR